MARNIGLAGGPGSGGDIIKEGIAEAEAVLSPDDKKLDQPVSQTPSSRRTSWRRVSQASADVETKLQKESKDSWTSSSALNESTDIHDKP